jgi:hypothetical protein
MTREDIIRMAREAGLGAVLCHNSVDGDRIWIEGADWHDEAERFAALVAEAEREALADYANALAEAGWSAGAIADALRARGSK